MSGCDNRRRLDGGPPVVVWSHSAGGYMQPVDPSRPERDSVGQLSYYSGLNECGAALKMELESDQITQQKSFDLARAVTHLASLPRENPRAQSAHGGDAVWFRHSR